ncbi:MAG: hypothetical protein FWF90_08620 [Promicromonosporaceae bacterium]|nr:hypothetical protein [Promicromonosporaceae bacterium]
MTPRPRVRRARRTITTLSNRTLLTAVLAGLALAVPLGWITVDHVATRVALRAHGVHVYALVVERVHHTRTPDELVVEPEMAGSFETTLYHSNPHTGESVDLLYDPRSPSRAIAADEPVVDGLVVVFALLDAAAAVVFWAALRALVELWRRWVLRQPRPQVAASGQPLAAGLSAPRMWLGLVVVPLAATVTFGALATSAVREGLALRHDGVAGTAVVEHVRWARYGVTELTVRVAGASSAVPVHEWSGTPSLDETMPVVLVPSQPRVVTQAGQPDIGFRTWRRLLAAAVSAALTIWGLATAARETRRRGRTPAR